MNRSFWSLCMLFCFALFLACSDDENAFPDLNLNQPWITSSMTYIYTRGNGQIQALESEEIGDATMTLTENSFAYCCSLKAYLYSADTISSITLEEADEADSTIRDSLMQLFVRTGAPIDSFFVHPCDSGSLSYTQNYKDNSSDGISLFGGTPDNWWYGTISGQSHSGNNWSTNYMAYEENEKCKSIWISNIPHDNYRISLNFSIQ
ncbi:MAG: hypothetical protein GF401_03960 [Chitinivibrionales bacterium]|nr:hypothetical protein [Chitinivibrionales bacterium]